MDRLWLRIRAPFAAFRGFQAGVYRATAPIMPPSAAFGLVLNLAGIEMRDRINGVTTLIRSDLPCLNLAIGIPCRKLPNNEVVPETDSEVCTLYQQLHSYPVGASGKELKQRTHGAKFWITPVRRELLVGLDMILGIQGDSGLLERVKQGLQGQLDESRYGLPFAGDNNFLFDQIDIVDELPLTRWYVQMQPDDPPMRGSYRLTVGINRSDNSRTTSFLYAPLDEASSEPPQYAWTWTPNEPIS
ncbi:type I-MYXAN CRISPR-associated protein Cas5/Cmx5/DevS [Lyngbya confervoides]|uniref:Type I-MYXAN CRISPR-associated protein Cas5/Cmx5/DevS n=1 Tax=Lyngbya confervoides BDU141951 TaxID=1574623 RepID=A0ABD4T6U6_9CYAN|nr:type I-MYXAN CRISPR-associated protein Cas5/Cmx5/DevS [Lyngbya confervoides]MCM1983965.1 type I-MYXAN CRISPR-associated protein Cas5/Cmx5/DevS [Lyngbya confervoides BDU141951]